MLRVKTSEKQTEEPPFEGTTLWFQFQNRRRLSTVFFSNDLMVHVFSRVSQAKWSIKLKEIWNITLFATSKTQNDNKRDYKQKAKQESLKVNTQMVPCGQHQTLWKTVQRLWQWWWYQKSSQSNGEVEWYTSGFNVFNSWNMF